MAHTPSIRVRIKRMLEFHRLRLKFMGERLMGHEFVPRRGIFTIEPSGRCNLSCAFCGYSKKEWGQVVMSLEDFQSYVDQAAELGYRKVSLTSSSGDLFMDRDIFDKFDYLERHPDIDSYQFYTNFVLPDRDMIERLTQLKKLSWMAISIYGHDAESFQRFTRRPKKQYERLVSNINDLAELGSAAPAAYEFHIRADRAFTWTPEDGLDGRDSELVRAMHRMVTGGGAKFVGQLDSYDTWGGMITPEDVDGLDIELADGKWAPKYGACMLLFDDPMIFADGEVNACACRAIDRSLSIGDLKVQKLADVLSPDNKPYRDIIDRHQRNDFPETCQTCMVYRSIYRKPRGWPYISLKEFYERRDRRP